ncbi:thermonuclease family protein, partial [Escherichia coli]|nr:micrococcal nuclease [Salmonella enterica subsp. enterica serovar Poona]EAR7605975.1 micrococcal nuclease [Salmonella enterica]EBV7535033.1 micrococcal nuclease [Salmonella enterica subsp. enterica serovar Berta]EBX2096266.1 micrococcal nuclease [Salmonella enterica subsp. enterica serovar Coeln]ECX0098870.1 micrococcal nuclease [Salmonella enterica subsp. enterica serovar Enteritidis]ECZ7542290.1 micrococcal nuclease [Salmonella enterica subsp. enterica serovar Rubislaw]EDR0582220.1 micro
MKILIIFALYILSSSLYANTADIQGKVTRVLDGDTIEILQNKTPVRIRLANIDAP